MLGIFHTKNILIFASLTSAAIGVISMLMGKKGKINLKS